MAEMMMNDPTGISMVMAIEEIFWGDAGIGMAIMGSGLAAAGIAAGTPDRSWSGCRSATATAPRSTRVRSPPLSRTPVRRQRLPQLSAKYDEAKDEWVLNGTRAWITNGGMADIHVVVAVVDPKLARRSRQLHRPARHRWYPGTEYKKHGIKASHTAEVVLDDVRVPGLSPRRQGEARRRLARVRRGESGNAERDATFEAADRPSAQALGIARAHGADRVRQERLRVRSPDYQEPGYCLHAR